MKTVGKIILCLIFGFFLIVFAAGFLEVRKEYTQSEKTTILCTGTISKIQTWPNTEQTGSFQMYIKEYNAGLFLYPEIEKEKHMLQHLQEGQKIYFRIRKDALHDLSKTDYLVRIVSLEVEGQELFGINDFNRCAKASLLPLRVIAFVIEGVTLCCLLVSIWLLVKKPAKRRN